MAHIMRDLFTGSAIVLAATALSFVALIVFLFLWIFFHVLGFVVVACFYVFLFFAALWFIGFAYRKMKEGKTER